MKRRTFLAGGVATAMAPEVAQSQYSMPGPGQTLGPGELATNVNKLRQQFVRSFDPDYVENVILPFFMVSAYAGERLVLPMIDVKLTKENALPADLWGLISETWRPNPQGGVTVFLQGLENRGPHNRRKRIYMSAVTPDLYRSMYGEKVSQFFDVLLSAENAGKPLMSSYLKNYWDLYWNLHLGIKGDAIPARVRQIGESFNTVLAYRDPTQRIVYDHYMSVRSNLSFLKSWIDTKVADVVEGRTPSPEKTFVYYWIKNGDEGENFRRRDVVFECFHNFVAFSQWGNTIYNIMLKLERDYGDPEVQAWFRKTMSGDFDAAQGAAFTPLECLVMELFRTISPNGGSISAVEEVSTPAFERHGYIISPHAATSSDPVHWKNPDRFDPSRYSGTPTSHDIDGARMRQIGFARCPFDKTTFDVRDGRTAAMHNSAFGTVYGVADGKPLPVCDYAGFAPFGFGYRRCPGEQLTVHVFEDFLRKVWSDKISFIKLDVSDAEKLPIGPRAVITDDLGFTQVA